jgi:hypothetical protein
MCRLDDSIDHQRDQDGNERAQADQSGRFAIRRGRPGIGVRLSVVAVVVLAGRRFTWVVWRSLKTGARHGRRS